MKNVFVIFICAGFFSVLAQTPSFQWARGDDGGARGVCVDGSGNVFAAGTFSGTQDFDPGPGVFNLGSQGVKDVFILKLDQNGNFNWVKQIGGLNQETSYHLKTDALGNLYLTGEFFGSVDFDPGPGTYSLSTLGNTSINSFILKLDANGNFAWAKQFGTGALNAVSCRDICIDPGGNVFTVGLFQGTRDFDPGPGVFNLTTGTNGTGFALKLDANGNFVWAAKLGGPGASPAEAVLLDVNGNIYVGGSFSQTGDFDPGAATLNLTAVGSYDGYISKLDINGNFVWVKQFSATGSGAIVRGLAWDCSGNICCGGAFSGTFDVDPGPATNTMTAFGAYDVFVAKLDQSGNYIWGKQIGGAGPDYLWDLHTDPIGDVYLTGSYMSSPADFDPGPASYTIASSGTDDIFISKLSSAGNFAWAYGIGSANTDAGFAIVTDASFNVYTTGNFALTVDFDPSAGVSSLTSPGGGYFIQKLSQATGTLLVPVAAPASLTLCAGLNASLSAVGSGSMSWYASPTSTNALATGSAYITPALFNTSVYYVESKVCSFNSSRASVSVNIIPTPSLTLATTNTLICKGAVCTVTVSGAQSYLWNNTATTSVISVTPSAAAASYTVSGTSPNSCSASASITFSVLLCSGIETWSPGSAGMFTVYPNPGRGSFHILTADDLILKISNETGQIVKIVSVKAGTPFLSLNDLCPGIYFVSAVDPALKPQKIIISP